MAPFTHVTLRMVNIGEIDYGSSRGNSQGHFRDLTILDERIVEDDGEISRESNNI